MNAERVITCWAMGLTQHKQAVATIQDVVNLHLLRGQIGKAGCGALPGSRPFKRAGRPHDGHLGKGQPEILRAARKGI